MPAKLRSNLRRITSDAERGGERAVRETLLEVQTGAALRSRVRSGEMRGGWHAEMLDAHKGVVRNPVEHAIYNELGTRDMSAQPMLGPAVDEARPKFVARMRRIYG